MESWNSSHLVLFLSFVSCANSLHLFPTGYTNLTYELPATLFSSYIGNTSTEACSTLYNVPVVFMADDMPLCARGLVGGELQKFVSSAHTLYHGKAVFVLVPGANKVISACSEIDVYNMAELVGAKALVSYNKQNNYPGKQTFLSYEQDSVGHIPFIDAGGDPFVLSLAMSKPQNYSTNLTCSSENVYVGALTYRYYFLVVTGIFCIMFGLRAIWMGRTLLIKLRNVGGEMRVVLLFLEGAVFLVIGVAKVLGIQGYNSNAATVGNKPHTVVKAIFVTGLSAYSFWTTVMMAMFWSEVSKSALLLRPMENVFARNKVLLLLLFLLIVTGEQLVVVMRYGWYLPISDAAFQAPVLLLNIIVAGKLWRQTNRFLCTLSLATSKQGSMDRKSQSSVLLLANQVAKNLRIYCLAVLLQTCIVPMLVLIKWPVAVEVFVSMVSTSRLGMSVAKIQALSYRSRQVRRQRAKVNAQEVESIGTHRSLTSFSTAMNKSSEKLDSDHTLSPSGTKRRLISQYSVGALGANFSQRSVNCNSSKKNLTEIQPYDSSKRTTGSHSNMLERKRSSIRQSVIAANSVGNFFKVSAEAQDEVSTSNDKDVQKIE